MTCVEIVMLSRISWFVCPSLLKSQYGNERGILTREADDPFLLGDIVGPQKSVQDGLDLEAINYKKRNSTTLLHEFSMLHSLSPVHVVQDLYITEYNTTLERTARDKEIAV